MDSIALEDAFFPKESRGRKKNDAYLQPDMRLYVERKKKRHKLLVKQFWQEYCSAALAQEKLAYSYQNFCEQFSAEADKLGATRHFKHTSGEKAYIDWAAMPPSSLTESPARRRRCMCSLWYCLFLVCFGLAALLTCVNSRGLRATWLLL